MRALLLTSLLLLVPASVAGAGGTAAKHGKAALVTCDTAADSAVFSGTIDTFGKATSLQLRFTLQARIPGGGGFKRVVVPGSTLDTWLSSSPGKKRYVYDQTVENLEDGASYRAFVRFRWRNAKGKVKARASKLTTACAQPDERPNLKATKVSVEPGAEAGTRAYVVKLVNKGRSPASVFATGLAVNGTGVAGQTTSEPLAAHASTQLSFDGPRCDPGTTLTVTADTGAAVDERNETDNVLAVPCPGGARRNA